MEVFEFDTTFRITSFDRAPFCQNNFIVFDEFETSRPFRQSGDQKSIGKSRRKVWVEKGEEAAAEILR